MVRGILLAGLAGALLLCAPGAMAIEAGIEAAAVLVYGDDVTIPVPEAHDGDANGIADLAHFRLLDAVLRDETSSRYGLVLAVWSYNLLRLQLDNKEPGLCELYARANGFSCDDALRTAAALLTISEPGVQAGAQAVLTRVGVTTDFQAYLRNAAQYVAAAGDYDADGYSNGAEYEAVCGEVEPFVLAATNAAVTPETLPCCRNCPLTITLQPQSARIYSGQSYTFTVAVENVEGVPRYQWFRNGSPIGVDAPALVLSVALPGDSGQYWCEITDDRGSAGVATVVSEQAQLTVANHMSFREQPADAQRQAGESQTFRVVVSGGLGTLRYQWLKDGVRVGGNSSTLTLPNLTEADSGQYWCEVRDEFERIVSRHAVLTVLPRSCYAEACDVVCSSTGIAAGAEQALRAIYTHRLVDENPDTTDADDNNIIDAAQARLLDRILADPALPAHCCVLAAYNNNLAAMNHIASQIPSVYFGLFVPRAVLVKAGAGLTTIGEPATLRILSLPTEELPGFPIIDPDVFDVSAAEWLAYNGDADVDGVANVGEFLAAVQGPEDFEAFVNAALDNTQREDGGGVEPCDGYFGILLAGDVWMKDAFRTRVFEDVLRARGYSRYRVAGSGISSSYANATEWGSNEHHELDGIVRAFQKYPEIEVVHLVLGAMDILEIATEQNFDTMAAKLLGELLDEVQASMQKVVDYILALKPTVQVVLADYDYLDPSLLRTAYPDFEIKPASQRGYNKAMTELGRRFMAIAQRTPRCHYVQNWGVLQYHLGNPPLWAPGECPFPGGPDTDYAPYPGGNPDYSSTPAAYEDQDGWRLNYQSHYWLFENAMDQFYAGVLTPDPVPEGEGLSEGEGVPEGSIEGEGISEGEGLAEGEGAIEGEGVTEGEGIAEGEGTTEGEGEGVTEGEGEPQPILEITPQPGTVADFGTVASGSSSSITVKLENTGSVRADGQLRLVHGAGIQIIGDGQFRIDSGKRRAISIEFRPTVQMLYTDLLLIDCAGSTQVLYLRGTGAPKSLLSCSGEPLGRSNPAGDLLVVLLAGLWLLIYAARGNVRSSSR